MFENLSGHYESTNQKLNKSLKSPSIKRLISNDSSINIKFNKYNSNLRSRNESFSQSINQRYNNLDDEIQKVETKNERFDYLIRKNTNNVQKGKRKVLISNTSLNNHTNTISNLNSVTDTFKNLQNQMNNTRIDILKSRNHNTNVALSKSYIDAGSVIHSNSASTAANTRSGSFMHTMTGFKRKYGVGSGVFNINQSESR